MNSNCQQLNSFIRQKISRQTNKKPKAILVYLEKAEFLRVF